MRPALMTAGAHTPRSLRLAALAVTVAAVLAFAACGSGDDNGNGDGGGSNEAPATIPAITPLPTQVELTQNVNSATGEYRMAVPPDWKYLGLSDLQLDTYQLTQDNLTKAEIAVTCEPVYKKPDGTNWTPRDYIDRDIAILIETNILPLGFAPDIGPATAAGVDGLRTQYVADLGGFAIRNDRVFVVKDDCAWILSLRVFATGEADDYAGLFSRIIATFETT